MTFQWLSLLVNTNHFLITVNSAFNFLFYLSYCKVKRKGKEYEIVMGVGQNILLRAGSIFCNSGGVSRIYGSGLDLENFPKKCQIFFFSGQKKYLWVGSKADRLLIYCGLKVCSGQVRAHL